MPSRTQRRELETAYRATSYRAETPTGRALELRVGRRHPELDAWLADVGAETWAYVTACNPGSHRLPSEENARRTAALRAELQALGHPFCAGHGAGDDGEWEPEASFLVAGIAPDEALALARRWGQAAILLGARGVVAQLAWTDG